MSKIDLKVVILGHAFVGKTSLVERFIYHRFRGEQEYQTTIGAVFIAKPIVSTTGKKVVLGLWDTAGGERYKALGKMYYRGSKAAIICYDVCDKITWPSAKFWVSELRRNVEDCKIYICGTKIDKVADGIVPRDVPLEEVEKYVTGILSTYYETSSKTGENVANLFQKVVDDFVSDPGIPPPHSLSLEIHENTPKRPCCKVN